MDFMTSDIALQFYLDWKKTVKQLYKSKFEWNKIIWMKL